MAKHKKILYFSVWSIVYISCQPPTHKAVISEQFITERDKNLNVDSVDIWHGPEGQHWLLATAKSKHTLPVYDATTGVLIKTIGTPGTGLGQFNRPNGIAIKDDLVFIVERDNKRLHILSLPSGKPLGYSGQAMKKPYGLAVVTLTPYKHYHVYVTDNYGSVEHFSPKKVHHYDVVRDNDDVTIRLLKTFGDDSGLGALWKLESIAVDPHYKRLFIADEHCIQKNVKIYSLDGVFTGKIIGDGLINYEPEGIALYHRHDGKGYVVVTDQDRKGNAFYIFDRVSLAPVGSFCGKVVRNTDGIAITNRAFGPFVSGAFYAVHDDGNVCAYDWRLLSFLCGLQEHEKQTKNISNKK